MKKIRLGNTFEIVWEIFLGKDKDKGKYDLTGKKLTIYLVSAFERIKISDFTTEFNVLRFTFEGKEQKHAGRYQLTFVENEGGDDTRTLNKCDAFEIVQNSCMETDDLSVLNLSSSFDALRIYPIIPQVGPNRNWWVDGVDTGKSSVGLTAYEFAKENGYEGTEDEYAAECLAVPVLNDESRTATAEAKEATKNATDAAENANNASEEASTRASQAAAAAASANNAAENADAAAEEAHTAAQNAESATERAEEAIEAFGPAIANKADKIKFESKSYVETDGISTNDFYYSMPDSADGTEDDIIATKSNLKKINGQDLFGKGNIVIEGKNYDNELAALQQKDVQTDNKLTELSSELGKLYSEKAIVAGETYTNNIYGNFKKGQIVRITIETDVEIESGNLRLFDDKGQIMTISSSAKDLDITLQNDSTFLQIYLYSAFATSNGSLSFSILTNLALDMSEILPIKEQLSGEKNYTSGGYLARPSSVIAADGYAYTDYIPVEPSVSITAYHGDVDKILTLLEYGEDLQYIDYWSQSTGTTSRTITTSANTRYVRFSFMEKNAPSVYLECNGKKVWSAYTMGALDKVNALWNKNSYPTEYEGCEVSVFTKCMCIGDSLTAGVFNKQNGYETIGKYSYPSIFAKLTGVETINKGVGGITSEQWYAQFSSESWSGCDMAIIQLGVNDAIQNGGWTSASKTAITNIINKLKSDNKGIKIFVATIIPATSYMGTQYDSVSDGIRALVAELNDSNVILVDIAQYGHSADNTAYNVGHLSAYGYWRLAQDYKSYISWIMANNMSVFRDIQFIGTSFVLA